MTIKNFENTPKMKVLKALFALISVVTVSCNSNDNHMDNNNETRTYDKGSFGYDLDFLKQHDSIVVLKNDGDSSMVIVSPKYQAKVFTSTANGDDGKSFGWINYKAFSTPLDAHMNAYGGENRFWLGPEGGKFSLFFPKGKEMVFDNWKTPAAFDNESWKVITKSGNEIQLQKEMTLTNYAGTQLSIEADRNISILKRSDIGSALNINLPDSVKAVGYLAGNSIKNTGTNEWNETTGMPCIWMLDMFNPSPKITIAIPYKNDSVGANSKVATTDYFGEIPADRIKYKNNVLFFKADGKKRGKLGIGPARAKPVAGSWDATNNVLTIIKFDTDANGKYLNQEWNTKKPAFSGDAVNSYNDGPLEDGSQMGPFYEMESVSPAAFLKPGESLKHNHYVFHFTGGKEELNTIAEKILGVSLSEIENTFQ